MRPIYFLLAAMTSSLALAEADPVTITASASAETQGAACEQAFELAREDALNQLDIEQENLEESESRTLELRSRTDERQGEDDEGRFGCEVTATWAVISLVDREPETTGGLIGSVETIEGRYQADCTAANNGSACRRDIEHQAKADLLDELVRLNGITRNDVQLEADGFEGSQSFNYQGRNLTLTMDGEFYFRVTEPSSQPLSRHRPEPSKRTEGEIKVREEPKPKEKSFTDNLDFTLFYTWDHNGSAGHDEVAISNDRWGLGMWVNNRVGFSAFWGEERAGIADLQNNVHTADGRYNVQGIGIGYRVFDSRTVTLENMIHYVDAQPYAATLDPGCSGCTARSYEASDYYQASINLKTNTEGLNIGWKLTWKIRDDLSNYDSLSGGWYVELQL